MRSSITDRDSYVNAHRTYDDLHDLLGSLSNKLSDVSSSVDKEFLAAYRVHMLSVQSEIKELKDEVNRGVQALNSDGDVAKLEKEVNWFVEESTRLRVHYTSMQNDYEQMRSRLKAMNEQKVYLNEQLKAIMKRNRVLQAEIDYAKQFEGLMQKNGDQQGEFQDGTFSPFGKEIAFGDDARDIGSESLWEIDEEDDDFADEDYQDHEDDEEKDSSFANAGYNSDLSLPDKDNRVISKPYQQVIVSHATELMPLASANFVPAVRRTSSRSGSRGGSRGNNTVGSGKKTLLLSASSDVPGNEANYTVEDTADEYAEFESVGSPSSRERLRSPNAEAVVLGKGGVAHRRLNNARFQASVAAGGGNVTYSGAGGDSIGRASSPTQSKKQWGGQEGFIPTPTHHKSLSKNRNNKSLRSSQNRNEASNRFSTRNSNNKFDSKRISRRNRSKLTEFLRQKCPAEIQLEKATVDTFLEIRSRKVHAAKRGSIKRYPVSMTGAMPVGVNTAEVDTVDAARAAANAVMGPGNLSSSMPGLDEEEDALLGVPLIAATGGISGLGVNHFSDNDKFSCLVKFLLKRDVFKQVVAKLQESL